MIATDSRGTASIVRLYTDKEMKPRKHVDRFLGFMECSVRYAMKPQVWTCHLFHNLSKCHTTLNFWAKTDSFGIFYD